MILAIDLGSYNIKTSEGKMFISTFQRGGSLNPFGETILKYNGQEYTMFKGSFDNEYDKSAKDYIPNLLLAIYKSVPKNTTNIDLVLGVPVDNIEITKNFKEQLLGKTFRWSVNGKERVITINRFATIGEGISSFYTLDKETRKKPIIIIDIGGRTVNVIVFQKGRMIDKFTIPKGCIDLYDDIAARVNTKGKRYKAEQVYDLIERGIITNTEKEEKEFVRYIMNEISRKVDIDLYEPWFTGGGSLALERYLDTLDGNIMSDPLYSNVQGNKIIAKLQWRD